MQGKTRCAASAWLAIASPSEVRIQPPSPLPRGSLVCSDGDLHLLPPGDVEGRGEHQVLAVLLGAAAGRPPTLTERTVPRAKSRLRWSSSVVARAVISVTAFSGWSLWPRVVQRDVVGHDVVSGVAERGEEGVADALRPRGRRLGRAEGGEGGQPEGGGPAAGPPDPAAGPRVRRGADGASGSRSGRRRGSGHELRLPARHRSPAGDRKRHPNGRRIVRPSYAAGRSVSRRTVTRRARQHSGAQRRGLPARPARNTSKTPGTWRMARIRDGSPAAFGRCSV